MSILQDLNPESTKIEPHHASAGTKALWILTLGLVAVGLYTYFIDKAPPTREKGARAEEVLAYDKMPPTALNAYRDNLAAQEPTGAAAVSVALITTPTLPDAPPPRHEGATEAAQPADYSSTPASATRMVAVKQAQAAKQGNKKKAKKQPARLAENSQAASSEHSKARDVKIIDAIMQ